MELSVEFGQPTGFSNKSKGYYKDPLTELVAIKTGVATGKQLRNLSKEIAGSFDATDGAKKAHAKKERHLCQYERRGHGNLDTGKECKDS